MSETPTLVQSPGALAKLIPGLRAASRIAVDTEGNSFHAYTERVCLIQIAVAQGEYVVDPLAFDPRPLGEVFASGTSEIVFHGGDYDVRTMKRDFGFIFGRVFDTQVAARLLGWKETGLAALVRQVCQATISKEHQRSDWGRRPLKADQLAYAAADVRYLLPIREAMGRDLEARGLLPKAQAEFDKLAAVEPRPRRFDAEGWRRLRGARDLNPTQKAVLKELYLAREHRARESETPPFKVLAQEAMVEIARRLPAQAKALEGVRGLPPRLRDRLGGMILDAVRRGQAKISTGSTPNGTG